MKDFFRLYNIFREAFSPLRYIIGIIGGALLLPLVAFADAVDDLEELLRTKPQNHEKVYVQTDNSMYFIGDTLWYKAFVVSAKDHKPTNLSRLLYVELLTPDGFLVERQHAVVSEGGANGQFILTDTLYSGYYEIRAYTRWQLNFNQTEKDYRRSDKDLFFDEQSCKDFFRHWEGLYSRVVPVYQKPMSPGDYEEKYMISRPKQVLEKNKIELKATFFPEGGTMVRGVKNNIAFELTDQDGQGIDLTGTLSNGETIKTSRLGRGVFAVTPDDESLKATFEWEGEKYSFKLPKAEKDGTVMRYSPRDRKMTIESAGEHQAAAVAVLCRGVLIDFKRLSGNTATIDLSGMKMPSGVNEVTVYDADAQPIASRMVFVNNHDCGKAIDATLRQSDGSEIADKTDVEAYSQVTLKLDKAVKGMAVSVRDAKTDDHGFDTGNIMTDMLLASDLKGFVADPAYYFESDDEEHVQALDLLMQIQGWRRYKRVAHAQFLPETNLTFSGKLYQFPSEVTGLMLEDVQNMSIDSDDLSGVTRISASGASFSPIQVYNNYDFVAFPSPFTQSMKAQDSIVYAQDGTQISGKRGGASTVEGYSMEKYLWTIKPKIANPDKGMLEAEIVKGKEVAGATANVDQYGNFKFNLPAYYDYAHFFVKSYNQKDSVKMNMLTGRDSKARNEEEYPKYYVKRDLFYPVFSDPYSWYQTNSPETEYLDEDMEDDELLPKNSRLAGDHRLQNVVIRSRRRGRRGIDYSKPAMVIDAYDAYNMVTDRGLSFGIFDMKRFPGYLTECLFGNMGKGTHVNILAKVDDVPFWMNYIVDDSFYLPNASAKDIFDNLHLKRIRNVRVYTDYDLRTGKGFVPNNAQPNVTLVFELMQNNAIRPTYRDRYYDLDGITYREDFYSPDYSKQKPAAPKDYRRTLYWNPNVTPDADGSFTATFYNNSRKTQMKVNAVGVDAEGGLWY